MNNFYVSVNAILTAALANTSNYRQMLQKSSLQSINGDAPCKEWNKHELWL